MDTFKRKFLIPEVIQTSDMDCGPATLKALLNGFRIPVNYGRLREACQTDIDGTSIDTIEEIAVSFGLDAEQVIIPADYLFLEQTQALPSIIITRDSNGLPHFVVLWRKLGNLLQIMDPSIGRRWISKKKFMQDLYIHTAALPIEVWENYVLSDTFQSLLIERLSLLGIDEYEVNGYIKKANSKKKWLGFTILDASIRMIETLVKSRGVIAGDEAQSILSHIFNLAIKKEKISYEIIPQTYWTISANVQQSNNIFLSGTVFIQVNGFNSENITPEYVEQSSSEFIATLKETNESPGKKILHFLKKDGLLTPLVVLLGLFFAAIGITGEGLLFRGIISLTDYLNLESQRFDVIISILFFFIFMLALSLPLYSTIFRMGRHLESRFRLAFLKKIPQLGDRYFHSRLTSDMTHRAYEIRELRQLPILASNFFQQIFQLILTTAGIIFLNPESATQAIIVATLVVLLPISLQPLNWEQDIRFRTHEGSLSRYYLDALLGLIPIRTHSADRAIRNEYESLLVKWAHSALSMYKVHNLLLSIIALVNAGFTVWMLFSFIENKQNTGSVLLLLYWVLKLPVLGQSMADTIRQYPVSRNNVLRLLEPLTTPEESELWYKKRNEDNENSNESHTIKKSNDIETNPDAVKIIMKDVSVIVSGNQILSSTSLEISSGEHIAIVGSSGAGKSSLVGLLLGWNRPAKGYIMVDNQLLHSDTLSQLRKQTAWVDPSIQIWNRSMVDNIKYGSIDSDSDLENILKQADIIDILNNLPDGETTLLGESGGLVSGGEGQRVRLARAMYRSGARLVILDEPFRGLDRMTREKLLNRARKFWKKTTLLFISHDISETISFTRVLVVEDGQIVEDDNPLNLINKQNSRYYQLYRYDQLNKNDLWKQSQWKKLTLDKGRLKEN